MVHLTHTTPFSLLPTTHCVSMLFCPEEQQWLSPLRSCL
nr:MAG TPA: hypothetical protein [Caudoviricetes sp.]